MGGLSIWHILVVAIVVVLLFGRGRISDMMGDVAKGIRQFRKGLNEDDAPKVIGTDRPDEVRTVNKDNAAH